MIGYLFLALVILGGYFIVKGVLDKKNMLKAAKEYANKILSEPDIQTIETRYVNQDISCYRLDLDTLNFKALTKGKEDIKQNELHYKNLIRFKNLFDLKSNDVEYFQHKGYRHLLYPLIIDHKRVGLILIELPHESINDVFLKNKPKRDY